MGLQQKRGPRGPRTSGAEDGIRTRDLLLGKEMLYQLSHFRTEQGYSPDRTGIVLAAFLECQGERGATEGVR